MSQDQQVEETVSLYDCFMATTSPFIVRDFFPSARRLDDAKRTRNPPRGTPPVSEDRLPGTARVAKRTLTNVVSPWPRTVLAKLCKVNGALDLIMEGGGGDGSSNATVGDREDYCRLVIPNCPSCAVLRNVGDDTITGALGHPSDMGFHLFSLGDHVLASDCLEVGSSWTRSIVISLPLRGK